MTHLWCRLLLTNTKNHIFGVGCLCQSTPKINLKKTLEPRSRPVGPRSEPAIVEPRHCYLGGAWAWMAGAPTPPPSTPSMRVRPPWRQWSRARTQRRWSRARTCGCIGVEPERGGGGVEPGRSGSGVEPEQAAASESSPDVAAVESSPDVQQRWSRTRWGGGGVKPGRVAVVESSPDVTAVVMSHGRRGARGWGGGGFEPERMAAVESSLDATAVVASHGRWGAHAARRPTP
jgi:hypothetical protein